MLCVLLEDKKKGGENESFLWKHKHKIYSYESTVKHIFQIFFHENFAKVHIGYIDFRMFTKIISTQLEFYIL